MDASEAVKTRFLYDSEFYSDKMSFSSEIAMNWKTLILKKVRNIFAKGHFL